MKSNTVNKTNFGWAMQQSLRFNYLQIISTYLDLINRLNNFFLELFLTAAGIKELDFGAIQLSYTTKTKSTVRAVT